MGDAQPARHGRHEPLLHGPHQDVVADAVELQEHHAGGRGALDQPCGAAPVGEAVETSSVGVVVPYGQGRARRGGHGGHHRGDHHRRLRGRLGTVGRGQPQGDEQQCAVQEEDQQPEDEGGHEQQQPDQHRPGQGRQQTEGAGADGRGDRDPGGAVAVTGPDLEVREDACEHQHRQRRHGPHHDAPPDLADDPPPTPRTHVPHTSRPGPSPRLAWAHPVTTGGRSPVCPG